MLPNPIFHLFGRFPVYMYGAMIATGILAAFIVLSLYCKQQGVEQRFSDFMFYNGVLSIAVGFFSAALFQGIYNYIENPEGGLHVSLNNITFIGGLIGGVVCFLTVYAFCYRRYETRLSDVLSIPPCVILVAHAFGRVGCFFAGCCYGKVTESPLGVIFPGHFYPVHPTQLYEAIFLFLMFLVCSILLLKWNFRHNMSVYLISYGIFRFCLEFLRGDDRGELLGLLSPSQFWSLLMVAAGIGLVFLLRFLQQKKPPVAEEEAL